MFFLESVKMPFLKGWLFRTKKEYGGGCSTSVPNKNLYIRFLYKFSCLKSHFKIPPTSLSQRGEKFFPLLIKGDGGGLDGLFQSAKVLQIFKSWSKSRDQQI